MKWYFYCKRNTNYIDGISDIPYYREGTGELQPWCIEIEDPSEELITNFLWYKLVDKRLVKMDDAEMKIAHPLYNVYTPTNEEVMMESIIDIQYQLDCMSLGLNEEGGLL